MKNNHVLAAVVISSLIASARAFGGGAGDVAANIDLLPLGTGMGATEVYDGQPSSSFVIRVNGSPVLLVDDGLGVSHQCLTLAGKLPRTIYISHNHSDHAGELPVVLIVQQTAGQPETVVAAPEVLSRLRQFRIAELYSTGKTADQIAHWIAAPQNVRVDVGSGLSLRTFRGKHAEISYGFVLSYLNHDILGWSADSGFDEELYKAIAKAAHVVLDGRLKSSSEHASFAEIEQYQAKHPFEDLWITHYGRLEDAPQNLKFLKVGESVQLYAPDSH